MRVREKTDVVRYIRDGKGGSREISAMMGANTGDSELASI